VIDAAGVVLAVPPWEAANLATADLGEAASRWAQLLPSPVVSIHVIYGSRVTKLPFAAVTGSPIRWVIDKTQSAGLHAGQYLAAAVPAADEYVDRPAAQLQDELLPALEELLPAAADADVEDFFVTRERRATIAQVAGSRRLRPGAGIGSAGFAVAGAWTDTGWPETMEGAVRSGQAAARKLIAELDSASVVAHAWPRAVAESAAVGEPPADSAPAAGTDHQGNGAPHQAELPGIADLAEPAAAGDQAGPAVSAGTGPVRAARR
jgi:predicted NAD/FAD-dependent oxidoreductase